MLHRLFLTFVIPEIEQEYRKNYFPYMISEYKNLTTLILFVGLFIIISFLCDENYYSALYGSLFAIPIIISRQFVCRFPELSNFVYPFLQICVTFIYSIYSNISNSNNIPKIYLQYEWYYGFFAAITHICIYLQGTILCFQTITMIGILGWHISRFNFSDPNGTFITVQILIVFVVVFFCRRELEKNKRLSFLKYRENMKWFQIMDKIIKKWTMCVQLDTTQDQLFLVQQSKASVQEFQITTNKQFRIFLRNILIEQTNSVKTQCGQQNLEILLRQILEQKYQPQDNQNDLKDSLYYKYIGYQQKSGRYLKIKLVEYYLQDSKMIVIIFQNEKNKLSHEWKKHQAIENYFRQLSMVGIKIINQTMKRISPKYQLMKDLFIDYNFFIAANIWLNSEKYTDIRDLLSIQTVSTQLKKIFGKSLSIEINCEQENIYSSFQTIIFMCVNLINYLQKHSNQNVLLKIIEQTEDQVKYLEFIFQTQNFKLPSKLARLLYQNIFFDKKKSKSSEQGFTKISESFLTFFELLGCPQSSLALALIKFLLTFYGYHNKIEYQKNQLKITVLDLTYFVEQ